MLISPGIPLIIGSQSFLASDPEATQVLCDVRLLAAWHLHRAWSHRLIGGLSALHSVRFDVSSSCFSLNHAIYGPGINPADARWWGLAERGHDPWPRHKTEHVKRLRTNTSARLRRGTVQKETEGTVRENRPTQEGEGPGPQAGTRIQGPVSPEGPQDNLGRNKVTFARNGFARVSMRSPQGTPHGRGAGDVLAEERGKVWATKDEFGLVSGLRAIGTSLLSVRGADRDVKGGVGVAQCRGENIRRSQVSARDEPRDLHLSRAVTRLVCCVYQRSDRVVSARGFSHRAAGRVGRAHVEKPNLASCTRHGFARPSAAQAQVNQSRARPPGALLLVHLEQD